MTRKSLSYLIETELEKAEVILAAKAILNKLQQIAENLAKMDANDVMPLGDAMREIFGAESASAFEQHVSETLRGLTEKVRESRNTISDQLDALEKGEPMNDLGNTDSSEDMFGGSDDGTQDAAAPAPEGGEDDDMFGQQHEDGGDEDMSDMFGGEAEEANSAGRMQKESVAPKKALNELSDDTLNSYSRKANNQAKTAEEKGDRSEAGRRSYNATVAQQKKGGGKPANSGRKNDPVVYGKKKVSESNVFEGVSADHRLTREFAGLIREGKAVKVALNIVAEAYAMEPSAVAEIITSVKKSRG